MCIYGIGLPFDHPIWRNLPPCRCGTDVTYFPSVWASDTPDVRWRIVGGDREVVFVSPDDEPDPTELLAGLK